MEFEFEAQKSRDNEAKHGIDFVEAQRIWDDVNRLVLPAKKMDEERYLIIGIIDDTHWSAIYTMRSEKVRIILVRRSRKEEREI